MLRRMLHLPDIEHGLVSVSSLLEDCHMVEFTTSKCAVKKRNCVVDVARRTGGMLSVNLQRARNKEMAT